MNTVVLDLMGVLIIGGHFVSEWIHPRTDGRITLEDLRYRYRLFATSRISREQFWSGLFGDWRAVEEQLLDSLKPNPEISAIRDLQGRCFLALFSEIPTQWGLELLNRAGLTDFFDLIVLSGSEGITKPEPEFFRRLVDRIPRGGRIVYVDDNPLNLRVGASFGMNTIFVHNPGHDNDSGYTPDHEVSSLAEARCIIGRQLGLPAENPGKPAGISFPASRSPRQDRKPHESR